MVAPDTLPTSAGPRKRRNSGGSTPADPGTHITPHTHAHTHTESHTPAGTGVPSLAHADDTLTPGVDHGCDKIAEKPAQFGRSKSHRNHFSEESRRRWSTTLKAQHEVPTHSHSKFILHGYRHENDIASAISSLFKLHNQTINVWTHFLGFVYFAIRMPLDLTELAADGAGTIDLVFFGIFFLCACAQMLASACYHLFSYLSEEWDTFMLRIDVLGIVLMIFGSICVGMHNGFLLDPFMRNTYMVLLGAPLLGACFMTASNAIHTPGVTTVRNTLLAGTTAAGVIPAVHWAMSDPSGCNWDIMWAIAGMFGGYGIGFMFYLSHFPERLAPGWFDLIGNSHQIWHVFVWLAGAAWLEGMVQYFYCVNRGECAAAASM